MERIIIKDIQLKGNLCIVKYNGNRDATMNAGWQKAEIAYFQNDVGIGGSVECEIVQKGEYTNITKVNMDSAEKNTTMTSEQMPTDTPKETKGSSNGSLMSQKDISIVSQCMVKCYAMSNKGLSLGECIDAYHEACLHFEQNG